MFCLEHVSSVPCTCTLHLLASDDGFSANTFSRNASVRLTVSRIFNRNLDRVYCGLHEREILIGYGIPSIGRLLHRLTVTSNFFFFVLAVLGHRQRLSISWRACDPWKRAEVLSEIWRVAVAAFPPR